jgi:transcription antitermination factor NusG
MKLYEILEAIESCVDKETGEIIDQEALDALEMEYETKVSNIACWIKDLKAEAEAIKNEKMNLARRQQICENKAESLKDYLERILGGAKFKDSKVSISYRKSEAVEVDDDAIDGLPARFIKIEKSVMKQALKDALKGGQKFDGCRLVEHNNIQIR